MARIAVEGDRVVVRLSGLERLGALVGGDISVPLSSVRAVSVASDPWKALRGMRAPGTGWPGVIALGHRRGGGIHDFAAVYRHTPAVVLDLVGERFDRLVVSSGDAEGLAAEIERAAG
jgi:hypothetical protein